MIIKTICYFLVLFLSSLLIVKGASNPGTVTISWFNYYIEMNIIFAIVTTLVFIFLVQMMMHLLTLLGILPNVIKYKAENKKLKTGLNNLKSIALNLSLGNKKQATKLAKKNHRVIPDYPVFDELLNIKAKTDLSNDISDLRYAKNKVDEFLTNFEDEKALKIVENILTQHPDSTWAKEKQYLLLLRLEDFSCALNILNILKKDGIVSKELFNLESAFINYQLAKQEDNIIDSLKFAEKGMKCQPNFIKLAEYTATTLTETEQAEKALKLILSLAKSYDNSLATLDIFKKSMANLDNKEKVKWLEKYYKINTNNVGCIMAKAESLFLQEKTTEAIEFLEVQENYKETLIMLSQLYKNSGENEKSIKVLEQANCLKLTPKNDLVKEYTEWKKYKINSDIPLYNENLCSAEKTSNLLLDND